jgi:hypothetical protein
MFQGWLDLALTSLPQIMSVASSSRALQACRYDLRLRDTRAAEGREELATPAICSTIRTSPRTKLAMRIPSSCAFVPCTDEPIHTLHTIPPGLMGWSMSSGYVSAHIGERLALTQSNHLHTDGAVIR